MILPVICELAFDDPGDAPTWVDISTDVRSFNTSQGRSTERDQMQAGTGTFELNNRHRKYDPTNTGSPYYPDVVPMRRIRLSTQVDSGGTAFRTRSSHMRGGDRLREGITTIALFQGYVESWPQTFNVDDATVTIRASDAFKLLNLAEFIWGERYTGASTFVAGRPGGSNITPGTGTPHPPDELTGTRINRVLDTFGLPAVERDVDAGTVSVWGSDVSVGGNTNVFVAGTALQHLHDVAAVEGGAVFVAGDGKVTFRAPFTPDVIDIWGDDPSELRYRDLVSEYDDTNIRNRITVSVSPALVAAADVQDDTSIARYGGPAGAFGADAARTHTLSLIAVTSSVLQARRDEMLARYKDPIFRITSLEVLMTDAESALAVLTKKLLDGAKIRIRPPAGGLIEQDSRIEQIQISSPSKYEWHVTWAVSAI